MKNLYKFLIVFISVACVASFGLAQSDVSPKMTNQVEKQAKPPSPQLIQNYTASAGVVPSVEEQMELRIMTELPVPAYVKKNEGNNGPTDSFCAPNYTYGCQYGDGFWDFAVEQIQNYGSQCANLNGNGWSEYYSLGPAILLPGMVYNFSMSVNYSNQHVNIWIDFNNDEILSADEMILYDYIVAQTGIIYNVPVTIPANATPGQHKMRVMCVWINSFTDPCGSYNYGEAEDYTVIIGVPDYGTVEGYVTANTGGAPIPGATIVVGNNMYTATSGANGFYQIPNVLVGNWNISCTKPGYNPNTSTITVVVNQTTTKNFAMTAPTMNISPNAINVIVDPYGTATEITNISNNGDGLLGWNASVEYLSKGNAVYDALKGTQAYAVKVYPSPNEIVTFDTDIPGSFTTIAGTTLDPFAGDFGKDDNNTMYVITYTNPTLYSIDVTTGVSTSIGPATGVTAGHNVSGMACDKTSGIMYVSSTNVSASDIYTVNLSTGALTLIGTTGIAGIIEIAIDGTGTMYAWDIVTDQSFTVDKATGASTLLGALGYDLNYAQGGNWDPVSDVIYLAAYTSMGQLMTLDKTTGALTYIGDFPGGCEVDALSFPGAAENWLSISPSNGNVNPGATFQMNVNFDALDIVAGTVKTANIHFNSTPQVGTFTMPVSMTVGSLQFGHITGNVILGGSLPYNIGDVTQVLIQAGPYSAYPNASGFYDLTAYPGTYNVTATLYGYQTQTVSNVVVPEGITVPNINFTMPCLYGIVTGTVTSVTTGLPIPNATVKLVGTTFQDVTDANGVYEIIVQAGTYSIKVNCVGYASQTVNNFVVTPQTTSTQNFNLEDLAGIIVVIDLDGTPNGQALATVIQDFFPGGLVEYTTSINGIPLTEEVQSVFLLLGIFSNNFVLTETEASVITTWLNSYNNRNLYMEGGDTWAYDTPTSLHSYFSLNGVADGSADLTTIEGIASYWAGNTWSYSGENNWIDHLEAISPAINVLKNPTANYNCAVAYNSGTYRTVGASFEITGMTGGPGFNIGVACVMAWFGYPVFTYGDLEGYVTELSGGAPIPGANITVGAIASGTSDANGYYYIPQVLTGTWNVSCTKAGYNPASATVTITENVLSTQNFQLTAPQMVLNPTTVSVEIEPNATLDQTVNISNPGNGTLNWSAGIAIIGDGGSDALFDLQFDWPVGIGGGEAGIECDNDYIYTTKWNGNEFYKYEKNGTYIGPFTCGSAGAVRDLAYDGTYFYGGAASTTVFQMDFTNGVLVSQFNAPTAVRAIAYNEDDNTFYANNWDTDITKFNMAGANLGSFPVGPVGASYYGFAYDNYSTGAPYLWGYAQTGNTLNELVQIQLPSGVETGVHVDVGAIAAVGTGIAGGLAITDAIIPGFYTILGTSQNVNIWGLELCESGPVWLTIEPNSGTLNGGQNQNMTLHFNAMDIIPGYYYANINFSTTPNVGSPVVSVTMHVEGLIPPTNLNVSHSCTDVILTWQMPAGGTPDSWNVYRDNVLIGNATAMTYTNPMVMPGVEYGYYVKAVYAGIESMPTATKTITVPTPTNLQPTGLSAAANVPNENDVTLTWNTPNACLAPTGYNVFRDGTQINASLVTGLTYVDQSLPPGLFEYYVKAVYYFGQSAASSPVYTLITGIEDVNSDLFRIYPNPVSGTLHIESPAEITGIQIYNNAGQMVMNKTVNVLKYEVDVTKFEAGIYYIKLETKEGSILRKITVN